MMQDDFYSPAFDVEIADPAAFRFERTRRLVALVQRHRDCRLLRTLRRERDDGPIIELIELEIATHGVPSRNTVGIRFRERIALAVLGDEIELVRVWMLRKTFPELMHQNSSLPDRPRELCLYFEPLLTALRTWTPASFIRRIQWWLEMSAKGTLHAADQPAEQLFFVSDYELVLPWNLDQLRSDATQHFVLAKEEVRPGGKRTLFLLPAVNDASVSAATLVEITLPTVVHGRIEGSVVTLGQLADAMSSRGVDLLSPLNAALQQRVGARGQLKEEGGSFALILLHIPIATQVGGTVERTQRRAYVILGSMNVLGEETGALIVHQQRYYSATGVIGGQVNNAWRARVVMPADVLQVNTSAATRRQSGIVDEGPIAALVGAGSLGSCLLGLWGRSGWGRWSVIDNDHVKPHNLSRHTALHSHIGVLKAHAVQQLHMQITDGASAVTAVVGDALDISNRAVAETFSASEVVIDATAGLDYPRHASMHDDRPRHISVFLTPSGNGAVLLSEDRSRHIRLRSLEAQYYRAMLREPWGAGHLSGHQGTFWSGASCRDISFVLPYERIVSHAGTLAEQVRRACASPDGAIRIWERDQGLGSVAAYEIAVRREQSYPVHEMTVYIDEGLIDHLWELRASALPNETGGILLGYHDFNVKALILVDVVAAPSDSKGSPSGFERGVAGLADVVGEASRRTANIVGYVGEWHSHPQGHSAMPSGDDLAQLIYLALGMSEDGLPAIQLIVSDNELRVLQGVAC